MNSLIGIGVAIAVLAAAFFASKRLGALIAENRRLRKRSGELTQMKKDFISYVSHELKAPLASMQETTHLLLERIPGPLTDKQKRLLELNLQSGKRLTRMIGNLLDLSRLEAGIVDYDIQQHDLAELVRNFLEQHEADAQDDQIPIQAEYAPEPLMVSCDSLLVMQMLEKIMEDALRVSSFSAGVHVDVRAVRDFPEHMPSKLRHRLENGGMQNGFALVTIADSGPRIEDSQKEGLFVVFHKMRNGAQNQMPSLGLGLPVARALAEAHHGGIWIEDNPKGGSVFCVLLPRNLGTDPGN